jgi:hypothetical protein
MAYVQYLKFSVLLMFVEVNIESACSWPEQWFQLVNLNIEKLRLCVCMMLLTQNLALYINIVFLSLLQYYSSQVDSMLAFLMSRLPAE